MLPIIPFILKDALLASIAAIGFASISNTPKSALKFCALIAAVGHTARYCLMTFGDFNIVAASLAGALSIGFIAIFIAPKVQCPPETFSFPALLPMIPGIYAYRTVQAFVLAISASGEEQFGHYFYLCGSNGLTCLSVIFAMVVGQLIPILIFRRISFSATRG